MTDISQLIQAGPVNDDGQPLPALVEGVVKRPPAHATDLLYVTIGAFDQAASMFGPCPWTPRATSSGTAMLPAVGDRCLVAFSDLRTPWVVGWWPQGDF